MELTNKVCLITGGTRGIGAALALTLADSGADLALVARNMDDEAKKTKAQIEKLGRRCALIVADVGIPEQAARCIAEAEKALGPVTVLVHSAGGAVNGGLLQLTPAAWTAAFAVHVDAVFHLARAVIPNMKKKKEGVIILISSAAGIRGIKTNIAYQTVKGALPQMTRALAYEFADDNIRVNCVAQGMMRTAFHSAMTPQAKQHNLDNRIPLHREGAPEQVASIMRELIQNDYITGETVTIDGGLTMRIC